MGIPRGVCAVRRFCSRDHLHRGLISDRSFDISGEEPPVSHSLSQPPQFNNWGFVAHRRPFAPHWVLNYSGKCSLSLQRLVDTSLFRSQKTARSTTGLKGRLESRSFCNKPQTPRYFARYFANLAVKWTFFCHFHRHFF